MTEFAKIRKVIEFEVKVDEDFEWTKEAGFEEYYDYDITTVLTEVVERRHEVDYVFDINREKELYYLLADGEKVFEHRNHDEIVKEYARLTGAEITWHEFGEGPSWWGQDNHFYTYGDPDESWAQLKRPKVQVDKQADTL